MILQLRGRPDARRDSHEGWVIEVGGTTNIASRGASMAVDWEQRVDFDRLRDLPSRRERKAALARIGSRVPAPVRPEQPALRHEHGDRRRGSGTRTSASRCVFRDDDPILWDFGSAARHHQLYCPWLPESSWRAWVPPMRGAMPDATGVPDALAEMIWEELHERGLDGEPVGMDVPDMTTLLALQRKGLARSTDSQPVMLEARKIKSADELALLDQAAGHRRRRLRGDLPPAAARRARERDRRRRDAGALRARLRARRGDQRDLGRSLQPASAHVLRPAAAPRRPGLLRHHPLVHGLPDLLLPHVQRQLRDARRSSTPTSSAASGSTTRSTTCAPARRPTRSPRSGRPARGDRHARRARGVRPAVRARARRRALRGADDLAPALVRGPGRARGRDGVRARDVLRRVRRPLGRAHRGGGHRDADRTAR